MEFQSYNIKSIMKNEIEKLKEYEFFHPVIIEYDNKIKSYIDKGYTVSESHKIILNDVKNILDKSFPNVEKIIKNKNKNLEQSKKVISGLNFEKIIAYSLINNVLYENIPELIISTGKPIKEFENYIKKHLSISIYDEILKSDGDIIIFNPNIKDSTFMIISCKTSLKERCALTCFWKIAYGLSICDCQYYYLVDDCPKNEYSIKTEGKNIKIGLVTLDLYDEINYKQNKGFLKLLDFKFLCKNDEDYKDEGLMKYLNYDENFVKRMIDKNKLYGIIDYLNKNY